MHRAKPRDKTRYGEMGYPAIERLIDTEDFDDLNKAFEAAYAELMDAQKKRKGLKTQKDTKKAMCSLELTMELLRELLSIKYRLAEQGKQGKKR